MKKIINVQTGEIIEQELTVDEIAQQTINEIEIQATLAALKAEAETRATAKAALLTQLGITEEQAKLLLS
jgi:hypothetical protein